MDSRYVTAGEVAARLHVSARTVRNWVRLGFKGIYLRGEVAGLRVLTTWGWVEEFKQACHDLKCGDAGPPGVRRRTAERLAEIEAEAAEAERLVGVG